MKIRMKVEGSGPDGMVQPGEEIEVGEATGTELVDAGLAELVAEEGPATQEEPAEEPAEEETAVELVEDAADDEEPAETVPENADEWPETEGDASGMDEWPDVEGDAVDQQE